MSEYDQTFDPNILIRHYDLISRFSDIVLYLGTHLVYEQISFTLCLRMTFDPKVDLISLFNGLPYISALNCYMKIVFTICLLMTRLLTLVMSNCTTHLLEIYLPWLDGRVGRSHDA